MRELPANRIYEEWATRPTPEQHGGQLARLRSCCVINDACVCVCVPGRHKESGIAPRDCRLRGGAQNWLCGAGRAGRADPPLASRGGISIQIQFVQSSDFEDNDLWFVPFVQVFDLRRATSESLYSLCSERSTMLRSPASSHEAPQGRRSGGTRRGAALHPLNWGQRGLM